jgi:hypothetical protein
MGHTMVNIKVKKWTILIVFVLFFFGCSTIRKGPLKPEEVRLTDLKIIETGKKGSDGKLYKAIIDYKHGEKTDPRDIKSACITWVWFWDT